MFILSGGCCGHSEKFDRFAAFVGECSIWILSIDFFFFGVQVVCQEKAIYFILGHLHKFISFPTFENALLSYILKLTLLDTSFALEQSLIQFCPQFLFIFIRAILFRQTQLLFPKALEYCAHLDGIGWFLPWRSSGLIRCCMLTNTASDTILWVWRHTCLVAWRFYPWLYTHESMEHIQDSPWHHCLIIIK